MSVLAAFQLRGARRADDQCGRLRVAAEVAKLLVAAMRGRRRRTAGAGAAEDAREKQFGLTALLQAHKSAGTRQRKSRELSRSGGDQRGTHLAVHARQRCLRPLQQRQGAPSRENKRSHCLSQNPEGFAISECGGTSGNHTDVRSRGGLSATTSGPSRRAMPGGADVRPTLYPETPSHNNFNLQRKVSGDVLWPHMED